MVKKMNNIPTFNLARMEVPKHNKGGQIYF